ncbi:hypothetical protein PPGU19_011520 [Paraburkholderia sp. PGU19]|uniref:hypothetical protein n=1 Tax=Paraburkholderia sp. PGU19 TaxID=2735434 RepID=UPI0015D9BA24|nr:hypothetical protein [Paraburkholderia sp. PGU19]BCF96583.1 hypothetical protein PPGU19_011520 [Paraburkholderia sp. PGU19]
MTDNIKSLVERLRFYAHDKNPGWITMVEAVAELEKQASRIRDLEDACREAQTYSEQLRESAVPVADSAMAKDAERLDWLDEMNAALNRHYGTTYQWKLILSPNITRLMTGRQWAGFVGDIDLNDAQCGNGSFASCREAIDAAIAASAEKERS